MKQRQSWTPYPLLWETQELMAQVRADSLSELSSVGGLPISPTVRSITRPLRGDYKKRA
jgi:hypothetical protein